jgi:crotonobetainyl-CoA:carnitine CoA-transferase CaiB-like acyl-CoA transferase
MHLRPVVLNRVSATVSTMQDHETIFAIHEAAQLCVAAAQRVRDALRAAGADERDIREAMSDAFAERLPALDHIVNVRAFIGCIAVGVKRGCIAGPQARLFLYTAQLQLAAMTRRVQ